MRSSQAILGRAASPHSAGRSDRTRAIHYLVLAALVFIGLFEQARAQPAEPGGRGGGSPSAIATDSPRATFESFERVSAAMESAIADYLEEPSFAGVSRLALLSDQLAALLDLGSISASARREVGIRTMTYVMDIVRRLPPVDVDALPAWDAEDAPASTRIPGVALSIVRKDEGPRVGEHLFSAATIDAAPRLFRALSDRPLRSTLDVDSFSGLAVQLTGPIVPPAVMRAMPEPMKRLWHGTPIWKAMTFGVVAAALAVALVAILRGRSRLSPRSRIGALAANAIFPLALLSAGAVALPWAAFQINLAGRFADAASAAQSFLSHVAWGWLFWLGVRMLSEFVILSPRISDTSLDANLLRLVSSVVGAIGVTIILALGGQAIGLPVLSMLAGLGIGGLAVALALRPTLENFVGGVMLYIDRPVRVGDFCSFGDRTGAVETIGVRSTKLRALDRTLITVPNAQFADMQIVNFAHCDRMLIHEVIGLRYETRPDQLRHLLAELRRMLHAHPRIDSDTVRVRFAGFGDSALNIDMRVYADTREWNDFFAIREDVFLRVCEIVDRSGSGFAFPSQTLYLARDGGIDAERAERAETAVKTWRRSGALPFPRLRRDEIDHLRGTLDYPPRGSVERRGDPSEAGARAEPLSTPDEEKRRVEASADAEDEARPR